MKRAAEIAFFAAVAAPLAAAPGFGEDALRAVGIAAVAGTLLARDAWSVLRRRECGAQIPALMLPAGAFLLFQAAGLAGAENFWEGINALLPTAGGIAVCAILAGGYLPREFLVGRGLPAFAAVGLAVGAYGVLQSGGGDPLWHASRAVSTLGSTIRSGAVAAMLAPPALAAAFAAGSGRRRLLGAAGFLASVALAVLSDSRAALLATVAGSIVAAVLMFLRRDLPGRPLLAVGILAAAVAVLLKADRIGTVFSSAHPTNRARVEVWKTSIRLAVEHPLLGCGTGNFRFAYPPYRSGEEYRIHASPSSAFPEVEDAHHTLLNLWCEGGSLSLLAFLWVLYAAFRLGRYRWRHAPDAPSAAALAGIAGGIASFLVSGMGSSLDRYAAPWFLFWLLLGTAEGLGTDRGRRRNRPAGDGIAAVRVAGMVAVLFSLYHLTVRAAADRAFHSSFETAEPAEQVARLQRSLDLLPPQWRAHAELGRVHLRAERLPDAQVHLERALGLHPRNVPALLLLAEVQARRSATETDPEERPARVERALDLWMRAIELAPFHASAYYNRGLILRDRGDAAGARRDAESLVRIAEEFERMAGTPAGEPEGRARGTAVRVCGLAVDLDPALGAHPAVRRILGR